MPATRKSPRLMATIAPHPDILDYIAAPLPCPRSVASALHPATLHPRHCVALALERARKRPRARPAPAYHPPSRHRLRR